MLWYLVFTVVILNGPVPQMKSDFIAYSTREDCIRERNKINANPDNSGFAECFFDKKRQGNTF